MTGGAADHLALLDYRRHVFALYAEVRTVAAKDPAGAHALWRAAREELFRSHPASALEEPDRAAFAGLRYFPYDPAYRLTAAVRPLPAERFEVATSDGAEMAMLRFGAVDLPVGSLEAYWIDVYGGGVFIPLRDGTSGNETYGGGRYLLDTVKGADLGSTASGELVLDLNFAYHPSCHYSPRWSCPLAPPTNRLAARIEAGEMTWR